LGGNDKWCGFCFWIISVWHNLKSIVTCWIKAESKLPESFRNASSECAAGLPLSEVEQFIITLHHCGPVISLSDSQECSPSRHDSCIGCDLGYFHGLDSPSAWRFGRHLHSRRCTAWRHHRAWLSRQDPSLDSVPPCPSASLLNFYVWGSLS
jgi:hypothetical protein